MVETKKINILDSHKPGDNVTIMNTMSSFIKLNPDSERMTEALILVYKDCDTGMKYKQEILDPDYSFYLAKEDKRVGYNRFFISKEDVYEVTVPHRSVEKEIARRTNNYSFYKQNIEDHNRAAIKRLHTHQDVFRSDMNIEDYYRMKFDQTYKNEPCKITKSYLDIEADTIHMKGDFPELGECPVNAVTLIILDTNQCYTFLLETKANPQISEFKKSVEDGSVFPELQNFVINAVNGPKCAEKFGIDKLNFNFIFYSEEEEILMISDIFNTINTFQPDFCLAWNMSFDIPYLMERIKVLGYDPAEIICHKDFSVRFCQYFVDERMKNEYAERGDYAMISSYTCYIDQMIQYASRRKGRERPKSFSLDYTGEVVAKVRKLDYKHITTNIAELPYKDYKTFVFYNIMDVIVQVCIESKTGDLDYMFTKSLVNNTRYSKCHRQTVYLSNRGAKEFDNDGFIMGNNTNKFNVKPETKFPGAFVADMTRIKDTSKIKIGGIPIRVFNNLNDFDYAALYPSNYRQFNLACNTQIGMIIINEAISDCENRQSDPSYSRGGQFLEDMQSHVWLEIGSRWFNLADFTQLVEDVEYFFKNVLIPERGLRLHDRNGKIDPLMIFDTPMKEMCQSPVVFLDPYPTERFIEFNFEKAKEWRGYAISNPNQQFR